MSHFPRHGTKLTEREESEDQTRAPFADVAARFANWFTGIEREHEHAHAHAQLPVAGEEPDPDPLRALTAGAVDNSEPSRFPVAPLGYNRTAVDQHLADLERELSDLGRELATLRSERETPMSVTEELERIGEQTASILVVAHDKANETTRLAQEQAERCIAEAAANAVSITEEAKVRLSELDNETDAVWRERERLLEDVRAVSAALASLADQASERFPAAADQTGTAAFPARSGFNGQTMWVQPQDTRPFTPAEAADARGEDPAAEPAEPMGEPSDGARWMDEADDSARWMDEAGDGEGWMGEPGDTASWLAGFEPPLPDGDDSAES
jgi:cell division septum initiation protein DivIVA